MNEVLDTVQRSAAASGEESRPGMLRRTLRRLIHFFSARFLYETERTRTSRAAGFRLAVPPTVFHPRWFVTSGHFAGFIGRLDLAGLQVADVGTGTGILALAAAQAGAARVVALDINPDAVRAAADNARANGLEDRVAPLRSDLLAAVPPDERFDVIVSNPPFFPGEPQSLADRAWHAGTGYRDLIPLFEQARRHLVPGGRFYILLSSESDIGFLLGLAQRAGFTPRLADRRSIWIESFLIYELAPG